MIKKALHAGVIGASCLFIGLHVLSWLLFTLLDLFLDFGTRLLAYFVGLRSVRKLGEGTRALAGRHVLSISELRGDAGAHVGHLSFVGLFLLAVDGSSHQLGHLGLELRLLLSPLNFGFLEC